MVWEGEAAPWQESGSAVTSLAGADGSSVLLLVSGPELAPHRRPAENILMFNSRVMSHIRQRSYS